MLPGLLLLQDAHPNPTPKKEANTRKERRVNGLGTKGCSSRVRKTEWPLVNLDAFLRLRLYILKQK
jgi:hypothetical protein